MSPLLASAALPPQAADRALVERIMLDEHIARHAPPPEWSDYALDLAYAALRALTRLVRPARDVLAGLGLTADLWAPLLLALLAALFLSVLVVGVLRFVRRRRAPAASSATAPEAKPLARPRAGEAWRAALEEHLRNGRVAEALEALWWWLASTVSRGPVDPSWTSRELLARADRSDLLGWAATLDRLTYGPRRPPVDDVHACVRGLEAAL